MIFRSITVRNFRQFYGTQTVFFAKSKDKNITVIHGENGSGKTTLLNALVWGLYGFATFENPEQLLNQRTEAELEQDESAEVAVRLEFRDEEMDYTVTRRQVWKKEGTCAHQVSEKLMLKYISQTGETIIPDNPQNTIDQILPERMHEYFFFNGERIDNLAKEHGADDVKAAIKNIMGLEILERAVQHLPSVRRRFLKELEQFGDLEVTSLIDEKVETEKKIEHVRAEIKEINASVDALNIEIREIGDKLRTLEGARELQVRHDELEQERRDAQERIAEIREQMRETASLNAGTVFVERAMNKSRAILEEKIDKGEIPAGIKRRFIDELLDRGMCICGTPLANGSSEREAVLAWRDRAGSDEIERRAIQLNSAAAQLSEAKERFIDNLAVMSRRQIRFEQALRSANEELDEVETLLDQKDSEEVQELVRNRRNKQLAREDLIERRGASKDRIAQLEKRCKQLDRQIDEAKMEQQQAQLTQRRAKVVREVRDAIQTIYEALTDDVRRRIHERITEVFFRFLRKGYRPRLNEDYSLEVLKQIDSEFRRVAMSQGERQITSLSFIGALVDIAREQHAKARTKFFQGGVYPIIMDAPFGTLDPDHRARIGNGIPSLAHQVVVMLIDSQWEGEVAEAMRPRIGKEYWLQYFNPEEDQSVKYEYTEIMEDAPSA